VKYAWIEKHRQTYSTTMMCDLLAVSRSGLNAARARPSSKRAQDEGREIRKCELAGIVPIVPKPLTSGSKFAGRFDKRDFVYDADRDEYTCPAGQIAIHRSTSVEDDKTQHKYWPYACPECPIKAQCTTSQYRRITRWEHERVLETMQERLDQAPEAARLRRQTVEHVFGTLNAWMGSTHFLTKTLPKVQTEMSLQVLAYNLKRGMKIIGAGPLMKAMMA
jgi:Transposase DDE domain